MTDGRVLDFGSYFVRTKEQPDLIFFGLADLDKTSGKPGTGYFV
jgi:hypothetical protein